MRRKSIDEGFTLIEILVALTVLIIGLVGILALFPVGLSSSQASVEDTFASLIADSVGNALISAMRNSTGGNVRFRHDGITSPPYNFGLPSGTNSVSHPGPNSAWKLGTEVSTASDEDPMEQYYYNFEVERQFEGTTPLNLYKFKIRVYRNFRPSTGSGPNETLLKEFHTLISAG